MSWMNTKIPIDGMLRQLINAFIDYLQYWLSIVPNVSLMFLCLIFASVQKYPLSVLLDCCYKYRHWHNTQHSVDGGSMLHGLCQLVHVMGTCCESIVVNQNLVQSLPNDYFTQFIVNKHIRIILWLSTLPVHVGLSFRSILWSCNPPSLCQ